MNFEENTVRYAQISAALSRSRFRARASAVASVSA